MKNNITVLIYAHNDEKHVSDCIDSARLLTSNILTIDIASQDKTATIAKQKGSEVMSVPYALYVEPVRMTGIKQVKTPWFFILDADERITPELASEVKSIVSSQISDIGNQKLKTASPSELKRSGENSQLITNYQVPRKNLFDGRSWLKHGGWWPDYQTRLIKTDAITDWPVEIHSTPQIKGAQGKLTHPLLHISHGEISAMVEKTIKFESLEADMLYRAGRTVSILTFFRKFAGELYRRLIKNKGFADGPAGIIESIYQAFSKTITYLFLYEKKITK